MNIVSFTSPIAKSKKENPCLIEPVLVIYLYITNLSKSVSTKKTELLLYSQLSVSEIWEHHRKDTSSLLQDNEDLSCHYLNV